MQQATAKIEELFYAALEIEGPAARSAFLDRACDGDPELRRRVEELLAADSEANSLLEVPAPMPTLSASLDPRSGIEEPGSNIGPYKLLEPIGEGGMGTVYMAEQQDPVRRRVALKLIKPGMDSKQVVARFEAERQALAMMDHPNIARVFDGGMTPPVSPPFEGGAWGGGRPYFVMELVRGLPITAYCDQHQLTIPERLELFVLVCRAVQHAHQKGIIHRDLKPSNVLVTVIDGAAVPKVIDFGVAKATGQSLTDKTLFTGFHQFVGTPLYVSPEQVELSGVDVDTRSDVYSLGVLLYELLTGTTPFDRETLHQAAFDEMRRIIREEEPPRPSTRLSTLGERLSTVTAQRKSDPKRLGTSMKGELDWVVMKALEKDRRRRYETANDFAADVMRYLTDLPVEAYPPSAWYRFAKFARRNRPALVTGLVVVSALVVGVGVSTWQAVEATRARRLAETRSAQTRQAVDEMYTQVAEKWLAQQPKLSALQTEFLEKALSFYQRFAAERGSDLQAGLEAARARSRVARIEKTLGRHDKAEASYRAALEELEALRVRHPGDADCQDELASALAQLAAIHTLKNRFEEAESLEKRAIAIWESLVERHPASRRYRSKLAATLLNLGINDADSGRDADAGPHFRRARDLFDALYAEAPGDTEVAERLVQSEDGLGKCLARAGKPAEAVLSLRRAVALCESLLRTDPVNPTFRFQLAAVLNSMGAVLGWCEETSTNYRRACEVLRGLGEEFPERPVYRELLLMILANHALYLSSLGRTGEADDKLRSALPQAEKLVADFPNYPDYRMSLAQLLFLLGTTLLDQGKASEAEGPLARARDLQEALVAASPDRSDYRQMLAVSYYNISHRMSASPDTTPRGVQWALEAARRAAALDPRTEDYVQAVGWALYRTGAWRKCIEALESRKEFPNSADFFAAMASFQLGDRAKARELFERCDQELRLYENRWSVGTYPEPATLRRIRAEAATLLGIDLPADAPIDKPT